MTGMNERRGIVSERNALGGNKGYSLVEMMVGSVVLAMVMAGSFSGMGQAFILNEYVSDTNIIGQVLTSEMEELQSLQWADLDNLPQMASFDPTQYIPHVPERVNNCVRIITPMGLNQKEIRLVITWEGTKGKKHVRELVSHYTKGGLFDYNFQSI